MSLDPNLVTAQWGLITAFGVAISLLLPKAGEYRNTYLQSRDEYDRVVAKQWIMLVQGVPAAVLAAVFGLSLLGAVNIGLSRIAKPPEQLLLLIAPIIAQLGFQFIVYRLMPGLNPDVNVGLQAAFGELPASGSSATTTNLLVENSSRQALRIWWINRSGDLDPLGKDGPRRIPPGSRASLRTFVGHQFLLRTEDGVDVGTIEAKGGPTTANITQDEMAAALLRAEIKLLPPVRPFAPSARSSSPARIRIYNKSGHALLLWWITTSGSLNPLNKDGMPSRIPPGEDISLATFVHHRFLLRTEDGRAVGIVEARNGAAWAEVTQRDIDAMASLE